MNKTNVVRLKHLSNTGDWTIFLDFCQELENKLFDQALKKPEKRDSYCEQINGIRFIKTSIAGAIDELSDKEE